MTYRAPLKTVAPMGRNEGGKKMGGH
jgi:hypothetical protein